MSKLEALFDAVIVKPLEIEETQYGSIIVPDMGKDRNVHGTVIAVGPGTYTVAGTFIKTELKEGDVVVLPTMGFTKVEHEGVEYFIGNEMPELVTAAQLRAVLGVSSSLYNDAALEAIIDTAEDAIGDFLIQWKVNISIES